MKRSSEEAVRAYLAGLDVGEPEGELSWREVGHRALEELQPLQRYRGFEVVRIAGQPLLFSEELNRLLSEPRIPLSFEQQAFRLRGAGPGRAALCSRAETWSSAAR